MLTPEGANVIWEIACGLADEIKVLAVLGPNGEEAYRFAEQRVDGASLILTATFPGEEANFEWVAREVRTVKGVVVDREQEDGGRKSPGAPWDLEVTLDLAAPVT